MEWMKSSTRISFPAIGIDINPHEGFTIGSFSIYFYGVILAVGLLLACIYGLRRKKQFGLTEDDVLDGALWIIPFAFICARIYDCAFSWADYKNNPISVLYFWEGGIAIYGGVIGTIIGIALYCRFKKIPFGTALDITAVSFLLGQAIGRWGNFMNREAFGAYCDNFLAMRLPESVLTVDADATPQFLAAVRTLQDKAVQGGYQGYYQVHPTFLYESLWNIAGFVLLHFMSKRRKYDGQVALGYAAWYGLGRCFVEGLRMDSLYWGPFRVSQLLAALSCFAAVTALVILSFKEHDPAKLYVNQVAAREAIDEDLVWVEEEESEETEETEESEETEETAEAVALPLQKCFRKDLAWSFTTKIF